MPRCGEMTDSCQPQQAGTLITTVHSCSVLGLSSRSSSCGSVPEASRHLKHIWSERMKCKLPRKCILEGQVEDSVHVLFDPLQILALLVKQTSSLNKLRGEGLCRQPVPLLKICHAGSKERCKPGSWKTPLFLSLWRISIYPKSVELLSVSMSCIRPSG